MTSQFPFLILTCHGPITQLRCHSDKAVLMFSKVQLLPMGFRTLLRVRLIGRCVCLCVCGGGRLLP